MRREPLLTRGVIVALATALLGALVVFGLDLTGEQTKAILTLVGALAPVLVAILSRPKVTPSVDVLAVREETVSGYRAVSGPAYPLADGLPVEITPRVPPINR